MVNLQTKKTLKKVALLQRFIKLVYLKIRQNTGGLYLAGRTAITSISTRHAGLANLATWNAERAGN